MKLNVKQIDGLEVKEKDSNAFNIQNQLSTLIQSIPLSDRRSDRPGVLVVDKALFTRISCGRS